jgi:hypothetical protein
MSAAMVAISKLAAVKTSPSAQAIPLFPHPRALKLSHQKIGIEQEDDKSYLDRRPPDVFLHGGSRLPR